MAIVGRIDAVNKIIEIKGEYPGFDIEIKILTFFAIIAYRDILVARKVLGKKKYTQKAGTGFSKSFTPTNNHVR